MLSKGGVMNKEGSIFLKQIRSIIEVCSKLESPERAARVTAFAICVMLDGSGEHPGQEYRVVGENNNDVEFFHHDL